MVEGKTKEEEMKDMETGDTEEGIYSDAGREELMEEEDEITDIDEGFMKGYEDEEKIAECQNCGNLLVNEKVVEEEFDNQTYMFCTSECASEFETKRAKKKN
ncbi:MAG: hypothetical protein AABX72_01165 [Nanoarchaeota archaeon]|mgnify:FL=1